MLQSRRSGPAATRREGTSSISGRFDSYLTWQRITPGELPGVILVHSFEELEADSERDRHELRGRAVGEDVVKASFDESIEATERK